MSEIYTIPQKLIEQIIIHLQEHLPQEACGLLAGKDSNFETWIPIDNVLRSPTRYRMDAEQQLKAFLQFEENQQDLLGIVHSHPNGGSAPSQIDIQEAYYPDSIYLIFYRKHDEWEFKAYRISQNQIDPVEIQTL